MANPNMKALLWFHLDGGMDGNDVSVPYDTARHDQFASYRNTIHPPTLSQADGGYAAADIRTDRDLLHPLTPTNAASLGGRQQAFAPELDEWATLFNAGPTADGGGLLHVQGTGPLIQPMTGAQFSSLPKPSGVESHKEMVLQNHTLSSGTGTPGWGGNILEAVLGTGASLAAFDGGSKLALTTGPTLKPLLFNPFGNVNDPTASSSYAAFGGMNGSAYVAALRSPSPGATDPFAQYMHATINGGAANAQAINNILALPATDANGDPWSSVETYENKAPGNGFRRARDLIARSEHLSHNLLLFGVKMGGFDTHTDQGRQLPDLMRRVQALTMAFYRDMISLGMVDNVLLGVGSDFSRTIIPNSTGTEHGWSGDMFFFGGGVTGGRILGQLRDPSPSDPQQYGNRIAHVPVIGIEQMVSGIYSRLGVARAVTDPLLPNLVNFPAGPIAL